MPGCAGWACMRINFAPRFLPMCQCPMINVCCLRLAMPVKNKCTCSCTSSVRGGRRGSMRAFFVRVRVDVCVCACVCERARACACWCALVCLRVSRGLKARDLQAAVPSLCPGAALPSADSPRVQCAMCNVQCAVCSVHHRTMSPHSPHASSLRILTSESCSRACNKSIVGVNGFRVGGAR